MAEISGSRHRGWGYWAMVVLAIVLIVFGLPIFVGGIWLLTLGGSFYYAIAGAGLLVTAYFMIRRSMVALWIYLATFAFTLVWAFWEVGLDGWAQVPRLVAPTIIAILVLLCIPVLRGKRLPRRGS